MYIPPESMPGLQGNRSATLKFEAIRIPVFEPGNGNFVPPILFTSPRHFHSEYSLQEEVDKLTKFFINRVPVDFARAFAKKFVYEMYGCVDQKIRQQLDNA